MPPIIAHDDDIYLKPIPGYEGYYASPDGFIWSEWRHYSAFKRFKPRRLKGTMTARGYMTNVLRLHETVSVHRMVLLAFVGPCPKGMETRHLNGIRVDNRLSNLCWGTASENGHDRVRHGTNHNPPGAKANGAKLKDEQVLLIRQKYRSGNKIVPLANEFGVCVATVWQIVSRKTWKHLP